jgi:hypothetical protein
LSDSKTSARVFFLGTSDASSAFACARVRSAKPRVRDGNDVVVADWDESNFKRLGVASACVSRSAGASGRAHAVRTNVRNISTRARRMRWRNRARSFEDDAREQEMDTFP